LRVIRRIANAALKSLSGAFAKLYSPIGRVSIPPERLMRAMMLQVFYSIRPERQLVERIDCGLLFRWFVGLGIEDAVWEARTFTKNRDRLLYRPPTTTADHLTTLHPTIDQKGPRREPVTADTGGFSAACRAKFHHIIRSCAPPDKLHGIIPSSQYQLAGHTLVYSELR
jgi:hypothetical protein